MVRGFHRPEQVVSGERERETAREHDAFYDLVLEAVHSSTLSYLLEGSQ